MPVSTSPRPLSGSRIDLSALESEDNYQKVKLPARSKQVTLFVDEETESKLTIQSTGRDGQSNILLAQLYLDRLGPSGQIFRFLGMLSTLYVKNAGPTSETSSQTIGAQGSKGAGC